MRLAGWLGFPRRAMPACLPALAALVAVLLGARAAIAEGPEDRARRLTAEFVAGWVARHPEEATRLGDHTRDRALPLYSLAAIARDAAWYRAQEASLAALPLDGLPAALAIDVRLARERAASEARALAAERLPVRDPGFVLEPLHLALSEPVRGFYSSACSRGSDLRWRLRAVTEYLRDAHIAVTSPGGPATEHAIERVSALLDLCRLTLPRAFVTCRDARVQADVAQADSLATAALMGYAEHLRDHLLPAAVSALSVDAAALAFRLERVAGEPVRLDSLLARARTEWSRYSGPEREILLDGFARLDSDSAEVLLESMRAELVRAGELSPEIEDRVEPSDRAASRGASALVTLGSWDSRGARARLELGPRPDAEGAPQSGALALDPMFSRVGAQLTLAREGIPGRATFAAAEKRGGSRVRQALGIEAIRDGWARYAESVWLGTLAGAERDLAVRWIDRLERERLARAVAELLLRVEGVSVEEAARWLAAAAPLAAVDARRAALEAAAAPRWAASTLALWKFRELRAEAERLAGSRFDAAAFHSALLRQGAVPTAWIAESVARTPPSTKGRRR